MYDEPSNKELGITPYPWGVTILIWLVIVAVSCGVVTGMGIGLWNIITH